MSTRPDEVATKVADDRHTDELSSAAAADKVVRSPARSPLTVTVIGVSHRALAGAAATCTCWGCVLPDAHAAAVSVTTMQASTPTRRMRMCIRGRGHLILRQR